VLRGGEYGEEHVVPLDLAVGGQPGYMRAIVHYRELTSDAWAQVWRSIAAATLIVGAVLAGTWTLLNAVVARPLHRYSLLAARIAAGEPIRMPVEGRGELGELGRAVNDMADSLQREATIDALTGLFNLRHLGANLDPMIAEARGHKTPLTLIVADMDNLKPVNDTLGHQAGDQLLRAVANALKAWAPTGAVVWRLGGDEYVIALPGVGNDDAFDHLDAARQVIASLIVASLIVPVGNTLVRPSISAGMAVCPAEADTAADLIAIADRRMYEAKTRRLEERRLLPVA
jgi:diguanylate cyclase (GGDEF)-like protein